MKWKLLVEIFGYSSSPTKLTIILPIKRENINIILAIDEKSNFIAMNIAMQPREKPIKYPIVAFILFNSILMTWVLNVIQFLY